MIYGFIRTVLYLNLTKARHRSRLKIPDIEKLLMCNFYASVGILKYTYIYLLQCLLDTNLKLIII